MRNLLAIAAVLGLAASASAIGISKLGTGASVTVGTTATLLDDTSIPDTEQRLFQVCNKEPGATNPIYVGDANVTASSGSVVAVGECWGSGVVLYPNAKVYAIASSSQAVRVQEAVAK